MALTGGLEATATTRAFWPARNGCCTHGLRGRAPRLYPICGHRGVVIGAGDPAERQVHFNAPSHRRFYALAFARRLEEARFAVEIFRLPPTEAMVCGLLPMKWLYVAICPQARET
jgi:hypothetical protein